MAVLLYILKLIGIILLALFGIILFLLVLLLFVPVRYRVSGQIADEVVIHAKLTWLMHVVSFSLDYCEKEFASCLRIFGIHKKIQNRNALDEDEDELETSNADETAISDDTEDMESAKSIGASEDTEDHRSAESAKSIEAVDSTEAIEDAEETVDKKGEGLIARIRQFFDKIRGIKERIQKVPQRASEVKAALTDEDNKVVRLEIMAELKYLLRHFKFRKLETDLMFATGDPAMTGQVLGVLCMFPLFYQYQVNIVPDFESEKFYVKGTFEIKGRMRILHLVATLIRLWRKKEIRIFVKRLLK